MLISVYSLIDFSVQQVTLIPVYILIEFLVQQVTLVPAHSLIDFSVQQVSHICISDTVCYPLFSRGQNFACLVDQCVTLVKGQEGFYFMYEMVIGGPTNGWSWMALLVPASELSW